MIGKDRVESILRQEGPMTMKQIINKIESEGEIGNVSYSVCKALFHLRRWKTIDYTTIKKDEPGYGSNPRLYRVIE